MSFSNRDLKWKQKISNVLALLQSLNNDLSVEFIKLQIGLKELIKKMGYLYNLIAKETRQDHN